MICGAKFSEDGKYRYELTRVWDDRQPLVIWIMLNPSTADAMKDDATIRRCIGFAKRWGFGGIVVLNLFAYRSTNPSKLLKVKDPVGPDNDSFILKWCRPEFGAHLRTKIVFAWGDNAILKKTKRIHGVHYIVKDAAIPLCVSILGRTQNGQPRHPVRLSYKTKLADL